MLAAFGVAPAAHAANPLQTAVYIHPENVPTNDAAANALFKRVHQTGATAVRLSLSWREIAPATRPSVFRPKDPGDTAYNWATADRVIKLAVANGLEPLVGVLSAPAWAGSKKVNPVALRDFASAITSRYTGTYQGLPRVRYWLAWNEPNLSLYLAPQNSGKKLVGAERYRSMVNAFATAAHAVRPDNVVVAGLVAPFTFGKDPGPLKFLRALLCMSSDANPRPTCNARTQFDILSVHPYTSGGPRHRALSSNDASLGDLPKVRRLLDAAVRAHHVVSTRKVQLWVTEFSWDSNPPDSKGVPLTLQAQWVSEALYRAWRAGVTMFTWFLLRDERRPSPYQSGLYFANGKAKPALRAFNFPFVALRRKHGVYVWGRAPGGKATTVSIEMGRRRLATFRTGPNGVFSRVLAVKPSKSVRARAGSAHSILFPLQPPRDLFVRPFG